MDFRILGPLEAYDADRPLALGGAKQRALLGMLLLHANEVVSSDRLIDALWGEEAREDAANALQVAISRLRKALEPDRPAGEQSRLLVTRPPGYELRVDDDQLDLHRFEATVEEGLAELGAGRPEAASRTLARALELWRGPPLADLGYEAFSQAEIARLDEARMSALEQRIAADLSRGLGAELVGELQSLVAAHPLRERLRGQLMLALYRAGRQADALEAFAAARLTLVEELGIEPGRELRELHEAILRQEPELELAAIEETGAEAEAVRGTLVGRESELATLLSGLDDALSGRGRIVLISGEPGIGKSRLADELARHAGPRGARVLVGRCWEAGGAPAYWPWVQALRSYVRETDPDTLRAQLGREGADLVTVLPELRELLPDLPLTQVPDTEGARFRLLESVAAFLRSAADSKPLVLLFDDLHASDAPSLLLLRFVAGELATAPILVVGCYRDTEVGPELVEALAELSRELGVTRLALKGLSGPETSQLLELTMGDAPTDELAANIQAGTQGNPLFATEIGRLLALEGGVEDAAGRLPIPEGVKEAIGRRLGRQSEHCRDVLALASVSGREFDVEVIGRASGLSEEELFGALDEADAARLVGRIPDSGGRMRFSHILVRDALYDDLPAAHRLRLHRTIAEALEGVYAGNLDPHLAELAHHYLEAGGSVAEKAIDYSQRAGDRSGAQHAYEEAARHYRSALRLVETARSGDAGRSCELLLSLGEVLSRAGSGQDAKDALRRAATLAEQTGRPDLLARAALEYGGRFAWARASTDPFLVPMLERALAAVGQEDSHARVALLARLAAASRDDASHERRVGLADEALRIARRTGDPVTLAAAIEGHYVAVEGPALISSGDGIAIGAELISLGEQIGDKEKVFAGHDHRVHCFWMLCDRAGVEVELDAIAALADELRQPAQLWHLGSGRTMLALMEGRFDDAEQLIADTLALGRRSESWNALVTQRMALFVLRREQGRLAELEGTMRRSVHEYPALLRFRCALAHLYAELDREREARELFDALLARELDREHRDAEWFFSISLLSDPCAYLGDEGAALRLYSWLLPYERLYAQAPVEAVFGSLARGLGVLATTLGRFDEAERHFGAAAESERRMGGRPWLAHAEHDHARMLLERAGPGDTERAGNLLEAATATYRELGMDSWAERAAVATSSSR